MQIPATEPTKLYLPSVTGIQLDSLRESLTYTDKKALYAYQNFRRNGGWFASKNGQEAYEERLAELKAESRKSLFFIDKKKGLNWTYSGLRNYLGTKLSTKVSNQVNYPEPKIIPWAEVPPYKMYPYQEIALERLLAEKHAGVQIGTGLGKSFIIANLIRQLGLKTVVMTPATNISEQLYSGPEGLQRWFGRGKVGAYFDGKKDLKKLITVANAQSLTRVEEGSPAWELLQDVQVFISDESHQCPAQTLAKVCFGALAKAPLRFFFSATQMRGDGLDLLLDAITGPIVYEKTVKEGVDEGYLAKPIFRIFNVKSDVVYENEDANAMTRKHLYYNPRVARGIGKLVNAALDAGMPTVILIEEVEQFTKLLPYLKHVVGFAHGSLNEENRPKVPPEFWDSDPSALVKQFNTGKLRLLVGTSCISTGTDIKPVKFLVYWQGGKSEVQVKQAVGRGTRLAPDKKVCHIIDFDVTDIKVLHRHTEVRRQIYDELYGPVRDAEL